MERRQFLGNLTAPVLTACAVCMGACSKSSDSSSSGSGTTVVSPTVDFTVNLATSLLTVGSSLVQDGVIVARLAAGNTASSFTAVQVACTHEGTSINFNSGSNSFVCPNHGSVFTTAGAVTVGPATKALKAYAISITGTSMKISG
ncbi:MAG: hypothetical protein RLZZ28_1896 [Bacteroidota bacterium]|jgi:Rieske Fe-S protein